MPDLLGSVGKDTVAQAQSDITADLTAAQSDLVQDLATLQADLKSIENTVTLNVQALVTALSNTAVKLTQAIKPVVDVCGKVNDGGEVVITISLKAPSKK